MLAERQKVLFADNAPANIKILKEVLPGVNPYMFSQLLIKKHLVQLIIFTNFSNIKGGENMDKDQIKSFVASLGIASLVAGASIAAPVEAAQSG